jgi:hypothetical protein
MKQTEIRMNLDGLEEIKREVGNKYRARVGVLGSHVQRDDDSGVTNAELMLIHMMGSITNNLPPRDALYMPLITKRRELIAGLQTGAMRDAFERKDYKKMFALLGLKGLDICDQAFMTGGFGKWAPLKPMTIKRKGSSAILINEGELRKSLDSDVVSSGTTSGAGIRTLAPP